MSDIARTRFEPAGVEPRADPRAGSRAGCGTPSRWATRRELLDRDPAAQHHRRAAHGARAQRLDPGRADPPPADARPAHASGSSAPTTRASRRSARSSSSCERLGTSREELGREAFLERVWSWRERYGATIVEQYKRLGASCDYADERFTLDRALRRRGARRCSSSSTSAAYIHRDNYMVNWDPGSAARRSPTSRSRSARRPTRCTRSPTRSPTARARSSSRPCGPETMLADTAVAVNPDDERYAHLVGREAILPLVGRRAADHRRRATSSPTSAPGALKITPGHDPNDFEIGRRHGLAELSRDRRGRADDRRGRRALRRA